MLSALAFAAVAASCLGPRADAFSLQAGKGDRVDVAGIGWEVPLADACKGSGRLTGGLLARLDGWHGRAQGGRRLMGASLTPFVRYELGRPLGTAIYLEGGIGVNLLSHTRIDERRQLGSAFQFGEFIGVVAHSPGRGQWGARFQHVSNGGIKQPNEGLTYAMAFFNYRF